jgi:hypothetical protein
MRAWNSSTKMAVVPGCEFANPQNKARGRVVTIRQLEAGLNQPRRSRWLPLKVLDSILILFRRARTWRAAEVMGFHAEKLLVHYPDRVGRWSFVD